MVGESLVQRGEIGIDGRRRRDLAQSLRAKIPGHVLDQTLDLLPSSEEPCPGDRSIGGGPDEPTENAAKALRVLDGEEQSTRKRVCLGHAPQSRVLGGDCALSLTRSRPTMS